MAVFCGRDGVLSITGFSLYFLIGKIKEWKHKRKMERDKRGVGLLGHYEVQMD